MNKTNKLEIIRIICIIAALISFMLLMLTINERFKVIEENYETLNIQYQQLQEDYTKQIDLLKQSNKEIKENFEKLKKEEKEKPVKEVNVVEIESAEGEVIETSPESEPATELIVCDETEILAKLLYSEAGICSWEGQVYVCSVILNLHDQTGRSVWDLAHDYNTFAVAGIVDDATPTQMQYDVIDYVLNGGRIPEINAFRNDYYHDFGTPVCEIDGVYFSTY